MKKRVFATLLALALTVALATPALAYTDTANHWGASYIDEVTTYGLFAGTGANKFEPDATMSRAMAVTVVWRFVGKPAYESIPKFTDIDNAAWYAPALRWAARCEIVTGDGDGRFRPNDPVSREELATMLMRALQLEYPTLFAERMGNPDFYAANWLAYSHENFIDGSSGGYWASAALGWATTVGLFEGDGDGYLRPGDSLTRAEAAATFSRAVEFFGDMA